MLRVVVKVKLACGVGVKFVAQFVLRAGFC